MKFSVGVALLGLTLTGSTLAGCMGPEGNPNGQPYANEPGGAMAVTAQAAGQDSYNPYGQPAPFADMQAGEPATKPSPTPPLNVTTQGAR
jgi:hypothetical protein